jgi:hypothetical protein
VQDIGELVHGEHLEILDLVAAVETPVGELPFDASGRRHLLERLTVLTARHETAERVVVWPLVEQRLPRGTALADAGREQETAAQYLLDAVRYADDDSWLGPAQELAATIRQHVQFEEEEIWTRLGHHLTSVGKAFAAREYRLAEKVSPTRPHPHGPARRAGLLTVGMAVSGLDRLRDGVRGRHPYGMDAEEERPVDAVALLQSDCARLRRCSAEAAGPGGGAEAQARMARQWSSHDWMEREHLYPLLRVRLDDGNDRYHDWTTEHGVISEKLAALDRYPYQDDHRDRMMEEVAILIGAHLDEEETSVLPRLRAHLTDDELLRLGATLSKSKGKAPSRVHPHLAGGGRGARLSRAVLSPIDRLRDLAARR